MRNRLLLLLVVVSVGSLAYLAGLFEYLDPDELRELIIGWGVWGPIVVVLLFSAVQPFGFPGMVFMMASATLWPFWFAFFINLAGASGAGMVGFGFARYIGRDWVEDRTPERIRAWDERLSDRGLPVVIPFRAVFFLSPAAHFALGVSRVRVTDAAIGTIIGFAPAVAAWTYFGAEILSWLENQGPEVWLGALGVIIVLVAIVRYRGRESRTISE